MWGAAFIMKCNLGWTLEHPLIISPTLRVERATHNNLVSNSFLKTFWWNSGD